MESNFVLDKIMMTLKTDIVLLSCVDETRDLIGFRCSTARIVVDLVNDAGLSDQDFGHGQ